MRQNILTKYCSHQLLNFGADPANSVEPHCIYPFIVIENE